MTLLQLILLILGAGLLAWLVNKAPFIGAEYKAIISWVILAVVVLYLISLLLPDILNTSLLGH
jgi:hypothetical protein